MVWWQETEVEARARARAVGSVGEGEALRGCCGSVFTSRGHVEEVVCSRKNRKGFSKRLQLRHVPRHVPWVQSVGEKRCGSVFASREKRRGCCVPAETQSVVARDQSGGRHVPWLQSVGEKRCGSVLASVVETCLPGGCCAGGSVVGREVQKKDGSKIPRGKLWFFVRPSHYVANRNSVSHTLFRCYPAEEAVLRCPPWKAQGQRVVICLFQRLSHACLSETANGSVKQL